VPKYGPYKDIHAITDTNAPMHDEKKCKQNMPLISNNFQLFYSHLLINLKNNVDDTLAIPPITNDGHG